jgi:ADP-dependent NAD(P)H-hydrate dehydratase / NAD(P)H-hydrate epimerase
MPYPVLSAAQIRAWDAFTIAQEPVSSLALMNRAAGVLADWFMQTFPDLQRPVCIVAGCGNNGGDGVALARLLHWAGYPVALHIIDVNGRQSLDFQAQTDLLPQHKAIALHYYQSANWPVQNPLLSLSSDTILVDALLGTGLNRPLEGAWNAVVQWINESSCETVAIDVPSGLDADGIVAGPCVRANKTFSFQVPKLAFFFPENSAYVGEWCIGDIGLHPGFLAQTTLRYHYITEADAKRIRKVRDKFSHKGTYGHALLMAGSYGKMGAAVLAARACLRAGIGLLTVHAPRCGNIVLQTAVPEAMFSADKGGKIIQSVPETGSYQAIGVGPGIGMADETAEAIASLFRKKTGPLVLDADALNLLSRHPEWWALLPTNSILTPHPKEFERLFGPAGNSASRLALLLQVAQQYRVVVLLKGAHTAIATPEGHCYFNSTGNPGMATAGSGDVLTGIITALLAQGYKPTDAAILGAFLHGMAGDKAAAERGQEALIASDLTEYL